ncbi:hypothetical protein FXV90_10730, partial [Staphylococcus pseudintermedius]|nr:hypothetical protein [Staphylococcus pseudintermedius]
VNKVAFLFGSALIAEGNYSVMGMVAVAVCTPPIGLGLATFIQTVSKMNHRESLNLVSLFFHHLMTMPMQ